MTVMDVVEAMRRAVDCWGEAAVRDALDRIHEEDRPYVCPGCYAVAEPCAPGCPDAAIEERRERDALDREDYDHRDSEPPMSAGAVRWMQRVAGQPLDPDGPTLVVEPGRG